MASLTTTALDIKGRTYRLAVHRQVRAAVDAPRLVVVSYQPNTVASEVLRWCIHSIQRYTPEPHELWVIDNASPKNNSAWLLDVPRINVVFNHTPPLPRDNRGFLNWLKGYRRQNRSGSYANAVALDLAARLIEPECRYLMTLHQDTMACRSGWLSFLRSKIDAGYAAAGVRMDRARVPGGVLHVLGYMVDFPLFLRLSLNFFPELPQLDVGDRVTVDLRKAGHEVFACRNTHTTPDLAALIPATSPLRCLQADRAFDDDDNVIFLHVGRSVVKSWNPDTEATGSLREWLDFAQRHLLA